MRALLALVISTALVGPAGAQGAGTKALRPAPQWLAVLKPRPDLLDPKSWEPAEQAAVAAHLARLQAEAKAGRVVVGGRTLDEDAAGRLAPDTLGLVIFEAPDRKAAQAWVEADPAVATGVMTATLHSYRIAVRRPAGADR